MSRKQNPVTLARVYAGLTQSDLAVKIGRKQSNVARMESGEEDYSALSRELWLASGFPESFFRSKTEWKTTDGMISFRKRSRCPAHIRNRADFYVTLAHSAIAPMIGDYIKYPDPDIPSVPMTAVQGDIRSARMAGAEVARVVRDRWGIGWGPIGDVVRVAESFGVRVFFVKEYAEHLDGFAAWVDDTPYIFLNQHVSDPARLRMDFFHELGHIVMHRYCEMDAQTDLYEGMAFGFAAEFLAPWAVLRREVSPMPDLRMLGTLRKRWKISMQGLVMHMHANGAISDAVYANLFKKFAV